MNNTPSQTVDLPKMYDTHNDLPANSRVELITLMNHCLGSAVDLQMQTKQAHWNVKGPHFIGLHGLFDQVGEAVESYVDLIAERIVQLGGIAQGTVRAAAAHSKLKEYPFTIANGADHVEAVANSLSTFAREARKAIDHAQEFHDADTADIFTEISRGTDKWLWFVEAHRQSDN